MPEFDPFPSDPRLRVERALAAVAKGEIVVLIDDEDRENEGDLVFAADKVTPEAIIFLATHGRGLICLSLTPDRVEALNLPMMVRDNTSPYGTAFTVSIEARTGVSTGISASDRARTIKVAVDPKSVAADLVSPGHVFPLRAREGGVLVRAGQTEGSVDLARLAGLEPAGVLCEIMNEDGTMARLPALIAFAREYQLAMLTVADLIAYRMQRETLVDCVAEAAVEVAGMGQVQAFLYRNGLNDLQYLALVKGTPRPDKPTLVRVTSSNFWTDAFQAFRLDGGPLLSHAIATIAEADTGVVLYIVRPISSRQVLKQLEAVSNPVVAEQQEEPSVAEPYPTAFRDYGLGAQVLRGLGVGLIRLITSSQRRLVGVEGYGLEVVERVDVRSSNGPSA